MRMTARKCVCMSRKEWTSEIFSLPLLSLSLLRRLIFILSFFPRESIILCVQISSGLRCHCFLIAYSFLSMIHTVCTTSSCFLTTSRSTTMAWIKWNNPAKNRSIEKASFVFAPVHHLYPLHYGERHVRIFCSILWETNRHGGIRVTYIAIVTRLLIVCFNVDTENSATKKM